MKPRMTATPAVAGGQFVEGLFFGEALVVGRDARCDVFGRLLAAEAGCVAVDALAAIVRCPHLGEATWVAVKDSWEIHHLAEVANPRIVE